MPYFAHQWIATDDGAECVRCGLAESVAIPDDGPMVSCHVVPDETTTPRVAWSADRGWHTCTTPLRLVLLPNGAIRWVPITR